MATAWATFPISGFSIVPQRNRNQLGGRLQAFKPDARATTIGAACESARS